MKSEKEILIVINEIYPKEKRCGNSMFEYGLFVKGFTEGFQKAEQMTESIIKEYEDDIKGKINLSFKKAKEMESLRIKYKELEEKYNLSKLA